MVNICRSCSCRRCASCTNYIGRHINLIDWFKSFCCSCSRRIWINTWSNCWWYYNRNCGTICGTYENYLFEGVREISAYLVLILTLIIYPRGLFSDKAEVKSIMRFIFKTKYSQDINIAKHNGDRFWYSLLILIMVALPLVLDDFYLGEISYICILSIAGIGLMILSGYTGLASLGHAAFLELALILMPSYLRMEYLLCVNSYRNSCFISSRCSNRNTNPTLNRDVFSYATLALGFIAEHVFIKWEHFTGGNRGLPVPQPEFLGMSFYDSVFFYYVCLFLSYCSDVCSNQYT